MEMYHLVFVNRPKKNILEEAVDVLDTLLYRYEKTSDFIHPDEETLYEIPYDECPEYYDSLEKTLTTYDFMESVEPMEAGDPLHSDQGSHIYFLSTSKDGYRFFIRQTED